MSSAERELELALAHMDRVAHAFDDVGRDGKARYVRDLADLLRKVAQAIPRAVESRHAIAQTLEHALATGAEDEGLNKVRRALAVAVRLGLHEQLALSTRPS